MLNGEQVKLRAYEWDDLDRCHVWINDPEVTLHLGVDVTYPVSLAAEEEWLRGAMQHTRPPEITYAIERLEDGVHIGSVSLHKVTGNARSAELGIMIGDKTCWDRGFGTDAIRTMLHFGFNVDANNQAARANFFDPSLQNLVGPVTERIEDETTIHLGLEKVFPLSGDFLSMYTLTLRGGAFTDPDHDGNALVDSDDTHTVFGIGGTFGDHLQIDIASEFSDRVDNIVLSAIYRF